MDTDRTRPDQTKSADLSESPTKSGRARLVEFRTTNTAPVESCAGKKYFTTNKQATEAKMAALETGVFALAVQNAQPPTIFGARAVQYSTSLKKAVACDTQTTQSNNWLFLSRHAIQVQRELSIKPRLKR